jgi:hypothetical protein
MKRAILSSLVLAGAGLADPAAGQSEQGCLSAAAITEADIAAAAESLSDPRFCISEKTVTENGVDWRFFVIRNLSQAGPLWAVPHDDEDAAFDSAVYAAGRHGGAIVAVEAGERRNLAGLDPNHLFRPANAGEGVCSDAPAASPLFIAAWLEEWDPAFPVIGLHSNLDGFVEGGGLGTISARRPDEKMIPFPSELGDGRLADEDTIVMIASMAPPEDNPPAREAIEWLNGHGLHVIYRLVAADIIDCTFADYLTLDAVAPYFNIEVEHGDAETQKILIDRLIEFLDSGTFRGML